MDEQEVAPQLGGKEVGGDGFDEVGFERPPSNWIKWGKIGDKLKGTFVGVIKKADKTGKMVDNYEILMEIGFYHDIKETSPRVFISDENPTVCVPGEIYIISGKTIISQTMRKARIGQKVLMKYVGDFEAAKGVAKTIEVKLGPVDEEWLKTQDSEVD